MGSNCFPIYTPDGKFHLSNYHVVAGMIIIALLPCFIESILFRHGNDTYTWVVKASMLLAPIAILTALAFSAINGGSYQPLHGDLDGVLYFGRDRIMVNEKVFILEDLTKISFNILDYKGRRVSSNGVELDGGYSQGVNNSLALYTKIASQPEVFYFQLQQKHDIREISDLLISYHLAGKLHFLQLIDLLGITQYDRIQDFKKTIYAGNPDI